jgi:outer membrane protein assembly factor BamB
MAYAPGVAWLRPLEGNIKPVGQMAADSFIVLQDGQLLALAVDDGRVLQQFTDAEETEIAAALLLSEQARLLTATRGGQVTAYALPEFSPIWQTDEISTGIPSLLPLGDAGVVAAVGTQLFALSADGELLWQEELPSRPLAWAETDRQLILTTTGSEGGTYLVAETGVVPFLPHLSGKVTGGARPFL